LLGTSDRCVAHRSLILNDVLDLIVELCDSSGNLDGGELESSNEELLPPNLAETHILGYWIMKKKECETKSLSEAAVSAVAPKMYFSTIRQLRQSMPHEIVST